MPQNGDLNNLLVGSVVAKANFWHSVSDDTPHLKNSVNRDGVISCNVKTLQDKWFSKSQKKFEESARSAEVNQAKNIGHVGTLKHFWRQQNDQNVKYAPVDLADMTRISKKCQSYQPFHWMVHNPIQQYRYCSFSLLSCPR